MTLESIVDLDDAVLQLAFAPVPARCGLCRSTDLKIMGYHAPGEYDTICQPCGAYLLLKIALSRRLYDRLDRRDRRNIGRGVRPLLTLPTKAHTGMTE